MLKFEKRTNKPLRFTLLNAHSVSHSLTNQIQKNLKNQEAELGLHMGCYGEYQQTEYLTQKMTKVRKPPHFFSRAAAWFFPA